MSNIDSSERGTLGLVRFVAVCLVIIGLLDGGLYFAQYLAGFSQFHKHHGSAPLLDISRILTDATPLIAGVVIFFRTHAVAEWLSDFIE